MKKYMPVYGDGQILDLSHDNNMDNLDNLVIIDKSVLTELVHNLNKAPFHAIRHGLRERIMETKSIEELLECTLKFSQFYTVVNYIKEQQQESVSMPNKTIDTWEQDYGNKVYNNNESGEL